MDNLRRKLLLAPVAAAAALAAHPLVARAQAGNYPNRPIEVVVPFGAGGGTDALARVFADAARKHISQPLTIVNKPGASGAIGFSEVINDRSEGYKLGLITVELAILPNLGVVKFQSDDLVPIVRLNADPSAITVRADAPWNTVEEFLEATRKAKGDLKVGNAGNGSIWHLAAVALEQKANVRFNHIPFQGGGPAVLSLLGGHLDAVTVSPGEVTSYVAAGKLKTLAVMADRRVKGFEKVPTLKERGIDLSIGTWRGLAAPKGTPHEVIAILSAAATKTANEPAVREALDKMNLGYSFADGPTFKADIARETQYFKQLASQLNFKN